MRNGSLILLSTLGFLACSDKRQVGGYSVGGHPGSAGGGGLTGAGGLSSAAGATGTGGIVAGSGGATGLAGAAGSTNAEGGAAGSAAGAGGAGATSPPATPRFLVLDPVDPSGALQADREYTVTVTGATDDGTLLAGTSSFGNLDQWPATGTNFYWTLASGVVKVDQLAAGYTSPSPGVLPDGTGLRGWYQNGYTGMYQWSPLAGYQLFALGAGTINTDSAVVSRDGSTIFAVQQGGSAAIFRWRRAGGLLQLSSLPEWPAGGVYGLLDVTGSGVNAPCSDDGHVVAGYTEIMSGPSIPSSAFLWSDEGQRVDVALPGFDACGITALSRDGTAAIGACFDTATGAITDRSTAFRWTAATGTVSLGPSFYSEISADGRAAVGAASSGPLFRWTADSGATTLQPPSNAIDPMHWGAFQITPGSLTANGQSFHGSVRKIDFQPGVDEEIPSEAFRWSATAGFALLAPLEGHEISTVTAASQDGAVLAGVSRSPTASPTATRSRVVLWDCLGTRDIAAELTAAGIDLQGMDLGWGGVDYVWSGPSIMLVYQGTTYHPPWIAWLPDRCR